MNTVMKFRIQEFVDKLLISSKTLLHAVCSEIISVKIWYSSISHTLILSKNEAVAAKVLYLSYSGSSY